ncbi:MAG: nitroreductase [Bacterioplanes sp.]|nr:nitroreductase [Bacterioplanes sp.]
MDALHALQQRVSVPQLTGPNITNEQKQQLFKAALRAPDHAWLRPSRYVTIEGDARISLGQILLESQEDWTQLSKIKQEKLQNMPLRAPLVIVAICHVIEHPKVPRDEQLLATGAGVQNILNASWALGLGAIWRTGDMAHNEAIRTTLGLDKDDIIVGFVYVGHVNCTLKAPPELPQADFVRAWTPSKT